MKGRKRQLGSQTDRRKGALSRLKATVARGMKWDGTKLDGKDLERIARETEVLERRIGIIYS